MAMKKLIIVVLALGSLSSGAARAEFLKIEAAQIATIEPADKSVAPRILVQWELPKDLSTKIIDGAVVTLTVPCEGGDAFEVDVHPLTKSWDAASVKWEDGWAQAGGDFQEESAAPALVSDRTGGRISADVYMTGKSQVEGTARNFGFILVSQSGVEAKIAAVSANEPSRLADAKLIIAYRNRR